MLLSVCQTCGSNCVNNFKILNKHIFFHTTIDKQLECKTEMVLLCYPNKCIFRLALEVFIFIDI